MHIDESLRFFAGHMQPRAIVIRGRWGVGKTYYWREKVVKGYFANANLRQVDRGYAYASLFGIESIQQLKNALAYSYTENQQPGVLRSTWHTVCSWCRRVAKFVRHGVADEVSLGTKGVGAKVKLTSLVDDFAFHSIRGSLICIDDIERRNKKLSIVDVLGLVSYLVDQRECRVAVILNFDALPPDDKEEWERLKDKTFEIELLYKPSMEESIEIGMAGAEHQFWHAVATESLRKLKIDNVRVVASTQRSIRQLVTEMKKDDRLANVPEDAWQEVVRVACLLTTAHASRGAGAPSVDELISNELFVRSDQEEQERLTDDQKKWRGVVSSYGLYLGDSLDRAIAESVMEGYPRMDLLVPAALEWQQSREKHARDQKFLDAWRLYHDSLSTDAETLLERFQEALPGVIGHESVANISATGILFRDLGRSGAATELFRDWIDARRNERRRELDERELFVAGSIDGEFRAMIEAARASPMPTNVPVIEALAKIESGYLRDDAIIAVSSAKPEEIVEALMSHDRNWSRCVQVIADYSGHGGIGVRARENFMEALRQVSATSTLNAMRIKGMLGGVRLDPVDDEASIDAD